MTLRTCLATLIAVFAMVLVGGSASAAEEFSTSEECIQSGSFERGMPTCTRSGDGPWVATYPNEIGPPNGTRFAMVGIFWILLMFVVPPIVAYGIANGRGTSPGLAAVLGLFLSWLGVIIVYVTFKPEVEEAARNVVRNAADPDWRLPRPAAAQDPAGRLAQLEQLKRTGLITESEYQSRRAAVIEEL